MIAMQNRPYEPNEEKKPLLPIEEMEMTCGSDTDMTGLIASGPQNREDLESYSEIYHFLPPSTDPDQM